MVSRQLMETTLRQMRSDLSDAFGDATEPAEEARIDAEIKKLDRKLRKITQMELNDAAALVAGAADDLMGVIRSAKTGALDGFLEPVARGVARLRVQIEEAANQETGQTRETAKTEDPGVDPPLPAPEPSAPPPDGPAQPPTGIPEVIRSKDFTKLKAEYAAEWLSCQIRADKRAVIDRSVENLKAGKARYEQAAAPFNGMPWHFVGIIHAMEAGFSFKGHLHNGDSLQERTVRVPRGRPPSNPPFTWEASARDALLFKGFNRVTDWSEPSLLYLWETYNGLGYRFKGLRTPYLWSFSNLYSKGRYIADGVFDPNAVSKQCGAAVLLKALLG
jgi:lysozyme family protein